MNMYTLLELLDRSIGSPEVGAVNFNSLHLVIKTIIEQTGLTDCVADLEETENVALVRKVFGKKKEFHDTESYEDLKRKLEELYQSEYKRNRDSKAGTKPDNEDFSTRMQLFQEEFEKMVNTFEGFRMETEKKFRRPRYEDGYKRERKGSLGMTEEELEDTLDDLGEAIARVAVSLKEQKYALDGIMNEEKLRDLCQKIIDERMTERENSFKLQLQNIATAVRNLQLVVKDVLYPEAPGVTDMCMNCGRKAHLPDRELINTESKELRPKNMVQPLEKSFQRARRKTNERNDRLKFTMMSLDRLKKDNESAFQDQIKDQTGNLCDDLGERFQLPQKELMADLCPMADATATFLPLRFMPDPNRRRILSRK